ALEHPLRVELLLFLEGSGFGSQGGLVVSPGLSTEYQGQIISFDFLHPNLIEPREEELERGSSEVGKRKKPIPQVADDSRIAAGDALNLMPKIDTLLLKLINENGSDLHLSARSHAMARIHGDRVALA